MKDGESMGIYLNPDNTEFYNAVKYSKIYVDKTGLITYTNSVLFGEHRNICVSRPRRFGKSMAANMLVAYYSRGCNSKKLFHGLKISRQAGFEEHLNHYNVIHLNIQRFLKRTQTVHDMLRTLNVKVVRELKKAYASIEYYEDDLVSVLEQIFAETKEKFVFVIDEWDCVFRMKPNDSDGQKEYLDFYRDLLKNQPYVVLAYMTGILPIKKYGEHSALNMFDEFSMTNANPIEEYTGFTEDEVRVLCQNGGMDFERMKEWYDGYQLGHFSVYNPKSVVEAIERKKIDNYWTQTETYESIRTYIEMNYDGLRDTIVELIAGERKKIDTTTFSNDMVSFHIQDDVLTLLIHLGYLAYDFDTQEVYIPNCEIREQFISTVRVMGWNDVVKSLQLSEQLLQATLKMNESEVADIIEKVHQENASVLKYNDENSLSCVLSLAYYSAKKEYIMCRELAGGKGFADLVFIPKKKCDKPAFLIELKWNKDVKTAIAQIKDRQYVECLNGYTGKVILVGLNYDKITKKHECVMESIEL